MAEAEKNKDVERSRSPLEVESNSDEDSDSSMTISEGELGVDGDVESMNNADRGNVAGGDDDEKDSVRNPRPFRNARAGRGAGRERNQNNQELLHERQRRLLNLLLPPWMRLGASRWGAAGGIASHTSRSSSGGALKRKREEDASDEGEEEREEKSESVFERRFFWTCSKDSGFPHRVNHAVAGYRYGTEWNVTQ